MLNGDKYITRGVEEVISRDLQLAMWSMVDNLSQREKFTVDYLQVFKLQVEIIDDHGFVRIKHSQEVEPYSRTILIGTSYPVNAKVFVIISNYEDGKEYNVMMLAEEY